MGWWVVVMENERYCAGETIPEPEDSFNEPTVRAFSKGREKWESVARKLGRLIMTGHEVSEMGEESFCGGTRLNGLGEIWSVPDTFNEGSTIGNYSYSVSRFDNKLSVHRLISPWTIVRNDGVPRYVTVRIPKRNVRFVDGHLKDFPTPFYLSSVPSSKPQSILATFR